MNYPDGYAAIPYLCELFMINDVLHTSYRESLFSETACRKVARRFFSGKMVVAGLRDGFSPGNSLSQGCETVFLSGKWLSQGCETVFLQEIGCRRGAAKFFPGEFCCGFFGN